MFSITVTEKGGEQRRLDFDKAEITIGRVQGNDVILPKGNVSKRHARIVLKDGKFIIVDLKSTNGTYVNGRKITSPLVVKETDKIYIGDFILGVEEGAQSAAVGDSAGHPAEAPPAPPSSPSLAGRASPPAMPNVNGDRPVTGPAALGDLPPAPPPPMSPPPSADLGASSAAPGLGSRDIGPTAGPSLPASPPAPARSVPRTIPPRPVVAPP